VVQVKPREELKEQTSEKFTPWTAEAHHTNDRSSSSGGEETFDILQKRNFETLMNYNQEEKKESPGEIINYETYIKKQLETKKSVL